MDFKEIFAMVAGIVLLIGLVVTLKLKNRKIRFMLNSMKDQGQAAASAPKRRHGGGGGITSVDLLEEGGVLADDVHDSGGKIVLLEAGTVLTKKNIEKLKNWEITTVSLK